MHPAQVWRSVPARVRPSDALREPIAAAFAALFEQPSGYMLLHRGEPLPAQATAASLCMFIPGTTDIFAGGRAEAIWLL